MTGTKGKKRRDSTGEVDMLPNLQKTPHGYTYRKTVPKDLVGFFGKTVFKEALGRNFQAAKARWAELEAETSRKILAARKSLNPEGAPDAALDAFFRKPLSKRFKALSASRPGLAEQIAALYLSGLSNDYAARQSHQRWVDPDEPRALTDELHQVLSLIKNAVVTGDVSQFIPTVIQLVEWRGYHLVDETGDQLQALTYDFLRAAQEGCRVLIARQEGEFADSTRFKDATPLLASWESEHVRSKTDKNTHHSHRLSDVTQIYKDRLSTSNVKTQTTSLSWWERLVVFCKDKEIDKVTSSDIYSFFENRLNAKEKPWSMKYCTKVANGLKEAFSIAKVKGLCTHNPVSDLEGKLPKISSDNEKMRMKPRFSYSMKQLNTIFESAWYDPAASNWRGRMKQDLAARYWVPLLCLYHGFRIREALQLRISDIEIADCPLIHIRVDDSEDNVANDAEKLPNRSVKNEATKRAIPIHPTILKLGFVEFLELAKRLGPNSPLFPSSLPEPGGKRPMWGRSFEQRFLLFVRDTLGFGHGYGNHSFRHTLEDCVRDIQLDEIWPAGLPQFYTGITLPSDVDKNFFREQGSERFYGEGYLPQRILKFVSKIQFKGLILPKPFKIWLADHTHIDPILIAELDNSYGKNWR